MNKNLNELRYSQSPCVRIWYFGDATPPRRILTLNCYYTEKH